MAAKDAPQAFIVSFGAEDYFLDRDIERALAWKDRHVIEVSGEDIDERDLINLCETGTIDGGKRVVVLDEAQKIKGDKALKSYIAEKDPRDDTTVVVAIVRSEKCPAIWSEAAKKGKLFEHKKLKVWDTNNEVVKWIEGESRRLGITLSDGIANTLFQLVGANLYRLANELRKFSVLLGKDGKVGLEHVRLVIAPSLTAEPFQVSDAAFAKDTKKAMNTLSTVYKVMGDDAHVPITFSLIRQIEKVILARAMVDRKASEEEISAALGMHPWRCKTHFLPIVMKHQMADLVGHMGRLRKLDEDVKSAARSKRTLVELAVLKISS